MNVAVWEIGSGQTEAPAGDYYDDNNRLEAEQGRGWEGPRLPLYLGGSIVSAGVGARDHDHLPDQHLGGSDEDEMKKFGPHHIRSKM